MARRKQNIARLFRNLRITERRFSRALRRLRRDIARSASVHTDLVHIQTVLLFRQHEITALNKVWFRRIMDLFARERIDYLEERIGQAKKADAYQTYERTVNRWIDQRAGDLSKRVTGQMVDTARDVLTDSVDQGWGTDKTSRELEAQLGGSSLNNDAFARTEMHTAANVGSDAAARATGLDMVKEWAATDDTRTRQTHLDADGQRVEMDERFAVGDAMLSYPGDPSGPAGEVINCRCVTLYHPRINGVVYD